MHPRVRVEPSTEMGKASKGDGAECVRAARIPYIMLIQRAHPRPYMQHRNTQCQRQGWPSIPLRKSAVGADPVETHPLD